MSQKAPIRKRIDNDFKYHKPKEGQPDQYEEIREHARVYAHRIVELTPVCDEQEEALKKLNEVVFWANAAIARND